LQQKQYRKSFSGVTLHGGDRFDDRTCTVWHKDKGHDPDRAYLSI
jgi:hypothetical protein